MASDFSCCAHLATSNPADDRTVGGHWRGCPYTADLQDELLRLRQQAEEDRGEIAGLREQIQVLEAQVRHLRQAKGLDLDAIPAARDTDPESLDARALALRLREALARAHEQGRTIEDVAAASSTSMYRIRHILRGNDAPKLATLRKLARALEVRPGWLLGE